MGFPASSSGPPCRFPLLPFSPITAVTDWVLSTYRVPGALLSALSCTASPAPQGGCHYAHVPYRDIAAPRGLATHPAGSEADSNLARSNCKAQCLESSWHSPHSRAPPLGSLWWPCCLLFGAPTQSRAAAEEGAAGLRPSLWLFPSSAPLSLLSALLTSLCP